MRYIDRRFLFPVAAATAWAQQQSPEAAAAEAALRARAEQFFQLQVDKKYRQAESMVADESKDAYYSGSRFKMDSFTITKVQVAEGNAAADVAIKARITLLVPAIGQTVHTEVAQTTHWKRENGEWVYFIDPDAALATPFGKLNPQPDAGKTATGSGAGGRPDLAALRKAVQVDRNSVEMKPGEDQIVKVSNFLPGPVDVSVENFSLPGVSASLDKRHLELGETTLLHIVASDKAAGSVIAVIDVSPLGTKVPVKVTVK
ncbi:MAG: hypothetical protein M3N93_11655 [Acidobacteriota bacterium]|nr:hypothetical protein [Acidobacteriota bacterium]